MSSHRISFRGHFRKTIEATAYDHYVEYVSITGDSVCAARPTSTSSRAHNDDRAISPAIRTPSRQDSLAPLRKSEAKERRSQQLNGQYRVEEEGAQHNGTVEMEVAGATSTERGVSNGEERGRPRSSASKQAKAHEEDPDEITEVLWENERGLVLCCCFPMFSSAALGNLDPAKWTDVNHNRSTKDPSNINEVPDPTWEWVDATWRSVMDDGKDDQGWEYSFMFFRKFQWHKHSKWWNSFVRRRAWTRKRRRIHHYENNQMRPEITGQDRDYDLIHRATRSRSRSLGRTYKLDPRPFSVISVEGKANPMKGDIKDIPHLLLALKHMLKTGERVKAVENFIRNSSDDSYDDIKTRMAEMMDYILFQSSRRLLLSDLLETLEEAAEQHKDTDDKEDVVSPAQKRLKKLEAALRAADAEVRKLQFWLTIKDMAERGETSAAVGGPGWKKEGWSGVDDSGPKDVLSGYESKHGQKPSKSAMLAYKGKGKPTK
ncbi:hypothetical protein BJ878DRAFT_521478 [Calycina marina]|uniref:Peroxin/Ferlin domain-containing protein n=1 Tax=Calycina marina TaxID=1763456 RepID=A0A9P8CC64_9HELO|nr:hypothetical protein BJ878DRAFT_521478 [Calycina marina]